MLLNKKSMLNDLITSKTRLQLLIKFFISAANSGYLRGLALEMDENTNAIRKELNHLSDAGYILRDSATNKIMYRANTAHPLFSTLQELVRKHLGIDQIITQVVERMGQVSKIYLTGDYAQGIDSGTINVVVEGTNVNEAYLEQLAPKIEQEIKKAVQFTVSTAFEGEGLLIFEEI